MFSLLKFSHVEVLSCNKLKCANQTKILRGLTLTLVTAQFTLLLPVKRILELRRRTLVNSDGAVLQYLTGKPFPTCMHFISAAVDRSLYSMFCKSTSTTKLGLHSLADLVSTDQSITERLAWQQYNSIQESFHGEAACFGQQKQARIHKVIWADYSGRHWKVKSKLKACFAAVSPASTKEKVQQMEWRCSESCVVSWFFSWHFLATFSFWYFWYGFLRRRMGIY